MFLLIDKPKGITSHDVVDKVRKVTDETKVGHAGTLDPEATGLLIVGIGRESTKKLGALAKDTNKTYQAEIFLGEERDTDDSEGKVTSKAKEVLVPSDNEIRLVLLSFLGDQEQVPPVFSAIKVKGKKSYDLARKGKRVTLKPRQISIHSIKLVKYAYPTLIIKVGVSSGTYIRALARDIGKKLDCGAYLKNLKRESIGRYLLEKSVKLANLNKKNWKKFAIDID